MLKPPVAVALIIGIAIGFAVRSFLPGSSTTQVASPAPPSDGRTDSGTPTTTPAPAPLTALAKSSGNDSAGGDTRSIVSLSKAGDGEENISIDLGRLKEQMKASQRNKDENRIALEHATLRDRLGLSEEQSLELREILDARAEKALADGVLPLSLLGGSHGRGGDAEVDSEVFAMLDDEQQAAYRDYLEAARVNEIEASATRELARLQSQFVLTETQKDQALQAFVDLKMRDTDGAPLGSPISPEADMRDYRQSRIDVLEPILTTEQMAVYRDSPMGGPAMFYATDFSDSIGSGVTIQSIAIESPLLLDSPAETPDGE